MRKLLRVGIIRQTVQDFEDSQVTHTAQLPFYATPGSGACDVHAFLPHTKERIIPAGEVGMIPTGLKFMMPEGWGLHIIPRSGTAKRKVKIANSPGLLDADYQGELFILVHNETQNDYVVHHNDRIAQLEAIELPMMEFEEMSAFPICTERGEGGFGHTGGVKAHAD